MDYEKKDYKKLYKDIVTSDWFKKAYFNKSLGECPFDIPELKDSEDERIRKMLVEQMKNWRKMAAENCVSEDIEDANAALDWLENHTYPNHLIEDFLLYVLSYGKGGWGEEKQKEQSITANDLDEEVHRFFDDCIVVHEAKLYGNISERVIPVDCYELTARHFAKWGEQQKEQKPAEWSEEDEKMRASIIFTLAGFMGNEDKIDWLKSLRSQPHWKPSEEQMYILNWVANILLNHDSIVEEAAAKKLQSLYEDLKKLM